MVLNSSSFVFHTDEKVDRGFVRLLGQLAMEVRLCERHARSSGSDAVHEMRVLIKRFRALLWFARPVFSSRKLTQTKSELRKASHLLAVERDRAVMRFFLKRLSRKTPRSDAKKTLASTYKNLDSQGLNDGKSGRSLQKAAGILFRAIQQIKRSAKTRPKWPSSSKRLAKAFQSAGKAGKKALQTGEASLFHDWRKKTKRLFYLLQLTQSAPDKPMRRMIKQVDKLQDKLGDYHDSVVVQARLKRNRPAEMSRSIANHCEALLETRKKHLRKKAQKIARRLEWK